MLHVDLWASDVLADMRMVFIFSSCYKIQQSHGEESRHRNLYTHSRKNRIKCGVYLKNQECVEHVKVWEDLSEVFQLLQLFRFTSTLKNDIHCVDI